MGCSASTSTSVSSAQIRAMENVDTTLAGRNSNTSVPNVGKKGDVHSISSVTKPLPQVGRTSVTSETHISTKTPKEKTSSEKKSSKDGCGRKTSGVHKESKNFSPYTVDLTKEMRPMRRASGGSQNPSRDASKRSTASIARRVENQRILEEESVSYILCSTKTPREALPPIKPSNTGSSVPASPASQKPPQPGVHKYDVSIPLSPIPKDKSEPPGGTEKETSEQKEDAEDTDLQKPSGKVPADVSGKESNVDDTNRSNLDYVNGDISGRDGRIELDIPQSSGDQSTSEIGEPTSEDEKSGKRFVVIEGEGVELELGDSEELQSENINKAVIVIEDSEVSPEKPTTNLKNTSPPEQGDTDQTEGQNNNSEDQQQHQRQHHHHHHHHHHHRRGQHQHQHQHQHHTATLAEPRSRSGSSGGAVSPEKTIKIMSKDAKTQFVFRALKSREEVSEDSNDTRDMLIQTDVISINDNNEKSKKKLLINLKRLGSKDEGTKYRISKGHAVEVSKESSRREEQADGEEETKRGDTRGKEGNQQTRHVDKGKDKVKVSEQQQQKGAHGDDSSHMTDLDRSQEQGEGTGKSALFYRLVCTTELRVV